MNKFVVLFLFVIFMIYTCNENDIKGITKDVIPNEYGEYIGKILEDHPLGVAFDGGRMIAREIGKEMFDL